MNHYPSFVSLDGCILRYCGNGKYWRDAGRWSVNSEWIDGKLVCAYKEQTYFDDEYTDPEMAYADGRELKESTMEEWIKDNDGWLPKEIYMLQRIIL